MKTLFEMNVAYDIGDAESGMLVVETTDYYDCEVDIFQSMEDIFDYVQKQYHREYADNDEFVGCTVVRLIPESEAEDIRKECGFYDECPAM